MAKNLRACTLRLREPGASAVVTGIRRLRP